MKDDVLARMLRMIGHNHLLEEGACVEAESLWQVQIWSHLGEKRREEEEGKQKRERVKIKKRESIKLIKEMEDG